MPDIKVFISSTYRDLDEHRKAVIERLRRLDDVIVVCMEEFGARAAHPTEVCRQKLESCDLYVGVFGCHYGSVPKGGDCSMTELEFRTAIDKDMPRLIFVSDDDFRAPASLHQPKKNYNRQQALRREAMADLAVDTFGNDPDKLANAVASAVSNWLRNRKKRKRAPCKPAPKPEPAPSPRTGPLHQLPSDIPDFTGRAKELDTLITALDRDDGNAAVVTAIRGMGGIGKTALAVHAARRLVARYPDAQIVVNLQGYGDAEPLKPVDVLAKVVQAFEPAFKPADDLAQMAALYRSVLDGKRALILLDNAPPRADLRALVPPPPCGLIVTARDRVTVDGATSIALGLLARSESVALLRTASRRTDVTDAEWERIAALCGDLPLALRVAGSFLGEAVNQTAADYLAALADERTRLDALRLDDVPDRDVGAVLGLSARALVRRDAEAAARWQMLTVFPADFDEDAAAAVWETDPPEARKILTALFTSALLLFDTDERRYRLHDLLRPVARRVFATAEAADPEPESDGRLRLAAVRHARHFMDVLEQADHLFQNGNDSVPAGLRLYDREVYNIDSAIDWAANHADTDNNAARTAASFAAVGFYILCIRLHPKKLIFWLEAALKAAQKIGSRELEAGTLGALGLFQVDLGDIPRAIAYHEQALSKCREIGNRRTEGRFLGNLGLAYAELGDLHHAIEQYEQALAISREFKDRRTEGSHVGNIGSAYIHLGDPQRAISYLEEALSITREVGDRWGEGMTLGNLAIAYVELRKLDAAIIHHEMSLAITTKMKDRRTQSNSLAGLGRIYANLNQEHRAIRYYEEALAIRREIGDRRGEGTDLSNLSVACLTSGDFHRARDLAEHALFIARETSDQRAEGNALFILGNIHSTLNEATVAIKLSRQALAIFENINPSRAATIRIFLDKLLNHPKRS